MGTFRPSLIAVLFVAISVCLAGRAKAEDREPIKIYPYTETSDFYRNRCMVQAMPQAGMDQLQAALADCNEAVRRGPTEATNYDSRGFVYLKLGQNDRAIIDYNAALRIDPKKAESLCGRGIAKLRNGDASGNADITAAKAIMPNIADLFARYGVK